MAHEESDTLAAKADHDQTGYLRLRPPNRRCPSGRMAQRERRNYKTAEREEREKRHEALNPKLASLNPKLAWGWWTLDMEFT